MKDDRDPGVLLGFGCASAPKGWERSRNVAWNQRFHKLRSHRGLVGPHERDAPPELGAGRRSRVRHGNENSQNEPGMSAGINEIENRGGEDEGQRGLAAPSEACM